MPVKKTSKSTRVVPSERDEQIAFVEWLRINRYVFTSIPNSAQRTARYAQMMKQEGLNPGLPDLLIIVKNQLVWIEMKKSIYKNRKNGGLSESQIEWHEALNKCANTQVFVCYGDLEAREVIRSIS
ncbi:MAG: VRR-NUC domain-containing protein [Candidatus Moranbacteria bacterium]|nr:VRR-NUC domain-containing protein [Candidatus Moranbacteria bacterium]